MSDPRIEQIESSLEQAELRILKAATADAATADHLYREATDLLIGAETVMRGSGSWLMACMHARRANGALCIKWLERARSASLMPDIETIANHAHFATARESAWFREWVNNTA